VSLLAAAGESGSTVMEVLAVGVLGLAVGLGIAWNRKRRTED